MSAKRYTIGLDLGLGAEPTTLAVLERPWVQPDDPPDRRRPAYSLRHLQRFPPGTSYPAVFDTLADMIRTPPLPHAWLLADYTGVGRAVVRMLTDRLRGRVDCHFSSVALTAGLEVMSATGGGFLIPKPELIGTVQVLLQSRRLQIARGLADADVLIRELENYRPKVVLGPADMVSWRDGVHDDLLLAVALAAWGGERALPAEGQREPQTAWRS